MIMRVEPVAVTRGQTVEITISGRENFDGRLGLLCERPGLRGEVLKVETVEPPQAKARPADGGAGRRRQVRARLDVAADAPLGPREVRVATPQGVSSVGLVVVVDDPVVAEADDQANDRPATAQKLDAARPSSRVASASSKTSIGTPSRPRGRAGQHSRSGATASRTRSTTCRRTSTRS